VLLHTQTERMVQDIFDELGDSIRIVRSDDILASR
jgi:hypothetical protein